MNDLVEKTSMFFASSDSAGCGMYRSRMPAEMLGKEWSFGFPPRDERVKSSKVIQIQRANNDYFVKNIPLAQQAGQRIIYDIDDNLWEIPSSNPAFRPYNSSNLKKIKEIMKLCNAITVSTIPLKNYFVQNRFIKEQDIFVIPNFLHNTYDYRIHDSIGEVKIGYIGTKTHAGDFNKEIVDAIRYVLDKYSNVKFYCVGYNPMPERDHPKIEFTPFVEVTKYHDYVYNLNLDIGLAPLCDNEFNRCKSNLKFLEHSSFSMVTIASNVYPYSTSIDHEKNGLIVKEKGDWKRYLELMIENIELRNSFIFNAHTHIDNSFTYKNNSGQIRTLYNQVLECIL